MKAFDVDRCLNCEAPLPPLDSTDSAPDPNPTTNALRLKIAVPSDPINAQITQLSRNLASDGFLHALFADRYRVPFHTVHINGVTAFDYPILSERELRQELRTRQHQKPQSAEATTGTSAMTAQFVKEVLLYSKESARCLSVIPRTRVMATTDETHPLRFVHPTYSKELHQDDTGSRVTQPTQAQAVKPVDGGSAGARPTGKEGCQILGSEIVAILTRHKKVDVLAPVPGEVKRRNRVSHQEGEQSKRKPESDAEREAEGADPADAEGSGSGVWLGTFPRSPMDSEEDQSERSRSPLEVDILDEEPELEATSTLAKGNTDSRPRRTVKGIPKKEEKVQANSRKRKRDDTKERKKPNRTSQQKAPGNESTRHSGRKKAKPKSDDTEQEEEDSAEEKEETEKALELEEEGLLDSTALEPAAPEPPPPPPPAPHQFYQERQQRIARNQERLRQLEILRTGGK
jgi:hypothetical protein